MLKNTWLNVDDVPRTKLILNFLERPRRLPEPTVWLLPRFCKTVLVIELGERDMQVEI